jgi:hypothetical protein
MLIRKHRGRIIRVYRSWEEDGGNEIGVDVTECIGEGLDAVRSVARLRAHAPATSTPSVEFGRRWDNVNLFSSKMTS